MMLLVHRSLICYRLAGRSKGLVTSSSALPTDYLCRQLHNTKCNDDGAVTKTDKTKSSNVTLCQINNHPDYRLRVAKERLAVKTANKQVTTTANQRANFSSKSRGTPIPNNNYKNNKVRESGLRIDIMENPVRSNDGTSSGAIINDRLRLARRKAIAKMKAPVENTEEAAITSERPHASGHGESKIEQEKFWMEMWKDAGNEIKKLRRELKEETDEAAIADMQADIKGLRKRKLEFAKLLGMDE